MNCLSVGPKHFEECSTLLSKRKFNVVLEKFCLDSKVEKYSTEGSNGCSSRVKST